MNNKLITKKINMRVSDLLIAIALVIFLLCNILDLSVLSYSGVGASTVLSYLTKLGRYVSYALCMVKFIYDAFYSRRYLVYLIIAMMIVTLSYFESLNKTMVLYLLLFLGVIEMHSEDVIRISFWTQSIMTFILVIGSQLGLVLDYIRIDSGRTRHFLGFSWTTTAPILFVFIILQYFYIRQGNISIVESAILTILSVFFYVMTNSRFAFLISMASIIFFFALKTKIREGKFVVSMKRFFVALPELIAAFAIGLHWFYEATNTSYNRLNNLLSGRLALGKSAIDKYGVHLFGQKIEWIGFSISESLKGEYNYVDCSYLQILLEYGLFFLCLVLVLYSVAIKHSIENGQYYLTWILVVVLIFSITEPRLFNLTFNPFILIVVTKCKKEKKGKCNN